VTLHLLVGHLLCGTPAVSAIQLLMLPHGDFYSPSQGSVIVSLCPSVTMSVCLSVGLYVCLSVCVAVWWTWVSITHLS